MTPAINGLKLRDVTPNDAAVLATFQRANKHAFRGLVLDHILDFSEAESAANWQETLDEGLDEGEFMLIAEDASGKALAYAWAWLDEQYPPYAAQLSQIAVLPEHQGRGIGRLLVCRVAQRLRQQQIHSLRVETLKINPNRPFYERLGAVLVAENMYNWDGIDFENCIYGWPNTTELMAAHCEG